MSVTKISSDRTVAEGLNRIDKILKLIKKEQRAKFNKESAEKRSELKVIPRKHWSKSE
jgi:hypothetical protein